MFQIRGVVEGFYGEPWSHDDRLGFIDFLKRFDYNFYVYGPKDDPYHRAWWDKAYPDERLEKVKQLVERCEERDIHFAYALAPGLSIRYGRGQDTMLIYEKLMQLYRLGVRHFGLFFDDVPRTMHPDDEALFGSMARAQAHVTNAIVGLMRRHDRNIKFLFCPTEYHGDVDHPYLHELGEQLEACVEVLWTGPKICSRTIPGEDALRFARVLNRKPLYWDNYPVNDAAMVGGLHIRPYRGRDPELADLSKGIILNPMPLFQASKFALASAATFFRDPKGYKAEEAFSQVLNDLGIDHDRHAAWTFFADTVRESPLEPDDKSELRAAIEQARQEIRDLRTKEGLSRLGSIFQKGLDSVEIIRSDEDRKPLVMECSPWLNDLETWCRLGEQTVHLMTILFDREEGEELDPNDRNLLESLGTVKSAFKATVELTTHTCGNAVQDMVRDVVVRVSARQARGIVSIPDSPSG